MTLYERVKETAKDRGYTLTELARKAGIGEKSVYAWKPSKTYPDGITPRRDTLDKIAVVLGVTVDYLLGNTDDPNPASKAGKPTAVDLAKANVFMYQGDQVDVDGIDPDDWAIIKAVLDRNRKNRKIGK